MYIPLLKQILLPIGLSLVSSLHLASAQSKLYHEEFIGTKIIDYRFENVRYGRPVKLDSMKGRWVLIDFINKNCTPCIRDIPSLDLLQNKYKSDISILIVTFNDMYSYQPESFMDGVRAAQNFKLPVAFDSVLWKHAGVAVSSQVVVIDPNGIIRDIVFANEVTKKYIRRFLRGHIKKPN